MPNSSRQIAGLPDWQRCQKTQTKFAKMRGADLVC
jgi:hypothetical protein